VKLSSGKELLCDNVMFATGRKPNSKDMGLEQAGVGVDPRSGTVLVDEYSRTNVESIFAIGDVTDRMNLTPVALMEGMAAARTMFGGKPVKPDHTNIPSAVFSQPPIGSCGMTEGEAVAKYPSVDVYMTKFKPMKHTMPTGRAEQEMITMKLLVVGKDHADADLVVGAHMLGEGAAEMMQTIGVAMKAGARKEHFDACVGIHPTAAEEWCTMRTKTRTAAGAYKVYYWAACKGFWGRTQGMVAMLKHTGSEFTLHTEKEVPAGVAFAVPVVAFPNGKHMGQTPAIFEVLGQQLGLGAPRGKEMEAKQALMDIADVLAAEFPPDEAKTQRINKWYAHLEAQMSGSGYFFQTLSCVDFYLYSALGCLFEYQQTLGIWKEVVLPEKLKKFADIMAALPAFKEMAAIPGNPPAGIGGS